MRCTSVRPDCFDVLWAGNGAIDYNGQVSNIRIGIGVNRSVLFVLEAVN